MPEVHISVKVLDRACSLKHNAIKVLPEVVYSKQKLALCFCREAGITDHF